MLWDLETIARGAGGSLDQPEAGATEVRTIQFDSRQVSPGDLFVPIVAERDGHDWIDAAVAAGAAGYLHRPGRVASREGAIGVRVEDTGEALLRLGAAARDRIDLPVVAITGSVGKTSTKDLAAAVLGSTYRVGASRGSFNNEIGVPLTLANLDPTAQIAVIEMGARGVGQVAELCRIVRPLVGVVTAVAAVHTEMFGSIEAVAQAKGELIESLPADGLAILNADDVRVSAMRDRAQAPVLDYSLGSAPAQVRAENAVLDEELHPAFDLVSPWGSARVRLAARGLHQVGNALAAVCVGLSRGVSLEGVVDALATAPLSSWRMDLLTAPGGARILNDAYNANPTSMAAALRSLAALSAERRVALLGEMAELGPDGPAQHLEVAQLAAELGIRTIGVGTSSYGGEQVADIEEAVAVLGTLDAGDAVLVKASRVASLERLAQRLAGS